MEKYRIVSFIFGLFAFFCHLFDLNAINGEKVHQNSNKVIPFIVDTSTPLNQNVYRLAVNLTKKTSWGAELHGKNLILNPGFEGRIAKAIVFVSRADGKSFSDDKNNLYTDGMWNEAKWEIRTGDSKGANGTIKSSVVNGIENLPQYTSNEPVPPLKAGDVIILSRIDKGNIADFWWVQTPGNVDIDSFEKRPSSPGTQSMLLKGDQGLAEVDYYMDSIYARSGKLINVEGKWKISFWAKSQGKGTLVVKFRRFGTPDFFSTSITPESTWKEYSFEFIAKDSGKPDKIEFKLAAQGAKIWIDDIYLGPIESDNTTQYRQVVIDTLNELKPSFLRTNAFSGDNLENRFAEPLARKYAIEGMHKNARGNSYYDSYQEHLDLCEKIGGNPWLVIPTTLSPSEYKKLGELLAIYAPKNRFSQVIVEFGNENWNTVFRPQVFLWPYYKQHGLVAEMAFENIKAGVNNQVNTRFLIGGQHANPATSFELLDGVPIADTLAPAAYFMGSLNANTPPNLALEMLFHNDPGLLKKHAEGIRQRGKTMAVYEFNLHTTSGNAPENERNPVVAGRAAGAALAKRALEALSLGANPICVFALSQYDSASWEIPGNVKLWGITRTFGPPPILRPTGLAMRMLNKVISGTMYGIKPKNSSTTLTNNTIAAAFKTPKSWTAAAVSSNGTDLEYSIEFPNDELPLPSTYSVLESTSPFDTNENAEMVKIKQYPLSVTGRVVEFKIPAWSLVTLESHSETKRVLEIPATSPPASSKTLHGRDRSTPEVQENIVQPNSPGIPQNGPYPMDEPSSKKSDIDSSKNSSSPPSVNELQKKVRELNDKQERILKEIQDLINENRTE